MKQFLSVPFRTDSGLSEVNGLGKFSSAGIVLEFESKLFGIIKSGVNEVRIRTEEILDIKFRKGFFKYGAKIEIRLKDFVKQSKLPNSNGKIILQIKRDDHERAREAVERLQRDLAELQQSLPPPNTPVRSLFDESEAETKDL